MKRENVATHQLNYYKNDERIMMKKQGKQRLIQTISLLLFPLWMNAQVVTGFVKDANTAEPLAGVNIVIDGTTNGAVTDETGFYRINIEGLPKVLSFSYVGYGTRKVSVTRATPQSINVQLVAVTSNLPEAVVSSEPRVDTIYKEGYSVLDYEFFDAYILLLVYRGVGKRYSVLLINAEGEELFEKPLGQASPVGFYKGCMGAVHFLTGRSAFQVYIENEEIYFYKPVSLDVFEALAYPCVLAAGDYLYFQNYYTRGQVVHYYRAIAKDTANTQESFAMIVDEERATMANDEYRFQEMVESLESFSARPMSIGELTSDASFLSRVVFEPIDAPMFEYKDTLLIFNHRFHQIEYYVEPKSKIKDVVIDYSRNNKWNKTILRDEETEYFYTLFDTRWGYIISKIDVEKGTTQALITLEKGFVSNLKVKGGYLYFLENNFRQNDPISKLQKVRIE